MLARPGTILNATVCLLALGSLMLGCGSDDITNDDSGAVTTEAEGAATTETTTASDTADGGAEAGGTAEELFPDVIDATAQQDGDGTWTVNATLSSPYDSAERYADGWRVVGQDGTVYGIRVLTHDHADEQPFTRSHSGIEIPEGVEVVTVEGRDQLSGWGGQTFELELPR